MDTYLKDVAKILAFAAGIAALPLIVAFAGLQPPWPPAVEYVSAVFILMAALIMWEWARAAKRAFRRRLIIAGVVVTTVGIASYLPLYSLFVEPVSNSQERVVRGTECTPNARLVYAEECPDLPIDALPNAEWNPDLLWTRSSIMRVRLALVGAWLCFTAGLIAFVGAVVAGRPVRAGAKDEAISKKRSPA